MASDTSAAHFIEKVNILANPMLSDLDKAVIKSTKRSVKPLKMKHVQLIVSVTWQREVAIYDLFRLLDERLHENHWVVAFKGLIISHILMKEGNTERVMGFLATQPNILNMAGFRDKSGTALGHEQSKNIRLYALYLEEKIAVYRELRKDVLKDKDLVVARLRSLPIEDGLLKEVDTLQRQIQALLGCKFNSTEIDNVVTMQAFRLLLADLMTLFHLINEGVIRILESFFDMKKADATQALGIYKLFTQQTTKVVDFFDAAKKLQSALNVEIPALKHAPVSLVQALEDYLKQPNFEENRKSYKGKSATSSSFSGASGANDTPKQASSSQPQAKAPAPQPAPPAAVKKPEVDFFSSLEEEFLPKPSQHQQAALQQLQPQASFDPFNPFGGQAPSQQQPPATSVAPAFQPSGQQQFNAYAPQQAYGTMAQNPFTTTQPLQGAAPGAAPFYGAQPQQQVFGPGGATANPFGTARPSPAGTYGTVAYGAPQQRPQVFQNLFAQGPPPAGLGTQPMGHYVAAPTTASAAPFNPFTAAPAPNMNTVGTVRGFGPTFQQQQQQQQQQQHQQQQQFNAFAPTPQQQMQAGNSNSLI